jgi:hypothetical protein
VPIHIGPLVVEQACGKIGVEDVVAVHRPHDEEPFQLGARRLVLILVFWFPPGTLGLHRPIFADRQGEIQIVV